MSPGSSPPDRRRPRRTTPGDGPSEPGGTQRPPGAGGPDGEGGLRPTGSTPLVLMGVVGLFVGWAVRPVSESSGGLQPRVGWNVIGLVWGVALVMALAAWGTWRVLHRHGARLPAHRAVNRLVLAKTCALVGAMVVGGFLGFAVAQFGEVSDLTGQRIWRSLLCAAGGVAITVFALLLERACRVPGTEA